MACISCPGIQAKCQAILWITPEPRRHQRVDVATAARAPNDPAVHEGDQFAVACPKAQRPRRRPPRPGAFLYRRCSLGTFAARGCWRSMNDDTQQQDDRRNWFLIGLVTSPLLKQLPPFPIGSAPACG